MDVLRGLTLRALGRAELARYRHQEEAVRPFAAVLRHADAAAVREQAAAAVAHAVASNPAGLGSGWRAAVDALTVAAADPSAGERRMPGVTVAAAAAACPLLLGKKNFHPATQGVPQGAHRIREEGGLPAAFSAKHMH